MSNITFLYKTGLRQLTKLQLPSYLQPTAVTVFINSKPLKTNGGVDVKLHTFLTSALMWANCQPPASPLYRLGKRHPVWTEGSFALEPVWTFRWRETCCSLPEMTPDLQTSWCSLSITNWRVALKLADLRYFVLPAAVRYTCWTAWGGSEHKICGYSKVPIVIATSTDWTYILRSDWM